MNVLIAGCGYLGTALGERIVSSGGKAWGLRRDPEALKVLASKGITPVQADLLDPASLKKIKAWGGKVLVEDDPKTLIQSLKRLQKNPDVLLSGSKFLESKHFEWDNRIHDPYLHQNLEALFKKKEGGVQVLHYRKSKEDLYFFANLVPKEIRFKARMRSQTKNNQVELRWPGSGETNLASVKRLAGGASELSLKLPALESLLVVFKR